MTKLRELWSTYSSQELFGESLREEDSALFDELDAAITATDEREPLVQEVIAGFREWQQLSGEDANTQLNTLLAYVCKLAEWKP